VLFLFPDQHRGDWLPGLPGSPVAMPTLETLASRGTRFANCITPSPLCAPARACIATGRDYDRTGVWNNRYNLPLELPTFYQALRGHGYEVASFGKLDLAKDLLDWGRDGKRLIAEWGFTAGFDSEGKYDGTRSYGLNPDDPPGPYLRYLKERGLADAHAHDFADRHAFLGSKPTPLPDDAYCDSWIGRNATDAIRRFESDRPWFLQVNFTGPHNPMDVTERMHARWREVDVPAAVNNDRDPADAVAASRRNYAAMLENIDAWCGEMLSAIEERGELEDTLVIYASDHGEMLGDHAAWGKSTWRRPSINVPFVVSGPGLARGEVCDTPVSLTDVTATILDLCEVERPIGMDSRSLKPLLGGDAAGLPTAAHGTVAGTAAETSTAGGAPRTVRTALLNTQRHQPGTPVGVRGFRTVVSGGYSYTLEVDGTEHLFDWASDPDERNDLASAEPALRRELRGLLLDER
jgi:arylsulfatase A-like enzyme